MPPTSPFELSDAQKQILFEREPYLREFDEALTTELERPDYDPNDYRAASWAYRKMKSRRSHPLLLAAVAASAYFAMSRVLRGWVLADVVSFLLCVECRVAIVVAATGALLLCYGLCNESRVEGVNRTLIMFSMSSLWLGLVAMIASVGYGGAAALMGAAVRVVPLAMALWYWRDLIVEANEARSWYVRLYKVWRWVVTVVIIVGGGLTRIIGLEGGGVEHMLANSASQLRRKIGQRFPVALSLCNDVGGLLFLACLGAGVGIAYFVYLIVYVSDLFQVRDHRKCVSILTRFFVKYGLYQPNVDPKDRFARLSGGELSLIPSPAMMLRRNNKYITADSRYLSTDYTLPILSLLEKEEEILRNGGMASWMKPRGEDVPLENGLTYVERSTNALSTWARPLTPEENDMSFAEFFETVEDDEYRYDPESGNWVFTDLERENEKTRIMMDKLKTTSNGSEPNFEELEKVVKDMSGVDFQDIMSSPELDLSLRQELLRFKKHNDEEEDDTDYFIAV